MNDKIPDPRDRHVEQEVVLSDDHPGSLAAFEDWCRQTSARSALNAIEQYRRALRAERRSP